MIQSERKDLPMTSSEGKELVQADASTTEAPEKVTVRSEWRPMESAPKDGTEILAWREDCGSLLVRWTSAYELLTDAEAEASGMDEDTLHFESWFCADFIQGCRLETDTLPTHWMPLPLAPDSSLNFSNEAVSDAVQLNQTSLLSSSDTEVGDK